MFARKTVTQADKMADGAPPQLPWHVRALAEAERRVSDLHAELEEANRLMRIFRSEHMCVIGRQLAYRCSDITGREKLDREWFAIVQKRDQLLREWHIALQEFAEVKSHT